MTNLTKTLTALAFVLVGQGVSACGQSTVIDATHYDHSCGVDTDCAVIHTGDVCRCSCTLAAINTNEVAQQEADRTAAYAACAPSGVASCIPCAEAHASCEQTSHRCEAR